MSVMVYRDADTLWQAASTLLAGCIIEKPASTLGLDSARTLQGVYRKLAGMTEDGLLDWSTIRLFHLFEHVRADANETADMRMQSMLFNRVNIRRDNIFAPNAEGHDWSVVCNDYENAILDAGGLDTILVSVGADGSLVYNMPAGELAPVTHVERTEAGRVVTVGISTIMSAKRVIAVLSGGTLKNAARSAVSGSIAPSNPASYLQLHANTVFMLDEDAAELI